MKKIFLILLGIFCVLLHVASETSAEEQTGECAQAVELISNGLKLSPESAIPLFDKASTLCPTMSEAHINHAIYLMRVGRFHEALAALNRDSSGSDDARLLKARIFIQLNRLDEAIDLLNPLVGQDIPNKEASLLLSGIEAKRGDTREALRVLLGIKEPDDYVRINTALQYETLGQLDEASAIIGQIVLNPKVPDEIRSAAANFYIRNGKLQEAAKILIGLQDETSKLLFAKTLIGQNDFEAAERVVRSVSESAEQREILAYVLVYRHQEEQALVVLQALEKQQGELSLQLSALRSYAQLSLGQTERARELAAAVIAQDASVALAHHVLGEALIRLGSKTAGKESKERAVTLDARFGETPPVWWEAIF